MLMNRDGLVISLSLDVVSRFILQSSARVRMTYQIDGGSASGIAVGDQLLLIDRNTIPQRTFEPGAPWLNYH